MIIRLEDHTPLIIHPPLADEPVHDSADDRPPEPIDPPPVLDPDAVNTSLTCDIFPTEDACPGAVGSADSSIDDSSDNVWVVLPKNSKIKTPIRIKLARAGRNRKPKSRRHVGVNLFGPTRTSKGQSRIRRCKLIPFRLSRVYLVNPLLKVALPYCRGPTPTQ